MTNSSCIQICPGLLYWQTHYIQYRRSSVTIDSHYDKYTSVTRSGQTYLVSQHKDVHRKTIENQHHFFLLEANYYLSVCNVHFKLALCTEFKKIDKVLSLYTKVWKIYYPQFGSTLSEPTSICIHNLPATSLIRNWIRKIQNNLVTINPYLFNQI